MDHPLFAADASGNGISRKALDLQSRLLDSVGQAVIATDLDGSIVYWSRFAETLYGWRAVEVLGRSVIDVTPSDISREQAAAIFATLRDGQSWSGEFLLRRRDGSVFPALVTDTPVLDADGNLIGVVGVSSDLSERKRNEERLREEAKLVATLQRIGEALTAELDLERVVQAVTDEATALTGAKFGAFFYNVRSGTGESYTLYTISGVSRDAFAKFPMPRNTEVFGPTFRGEGVVRSDDITLDPRYGRNSPNHGMPAGHLLVRSYLAVSVFSSSGEVLGGLFFGHPEPAVFTERHERIALGVAGWASVAMDNARLFEEARHAREAAEDANRAKSVFLATMSHEIRTPINAIVGYTELLEMGLAGPLTPGQRAQLERVRASSQHLLGVVNEVLDLAKVESGQITLRSRNASAPATVESALALVRPQLEARALEVEVRCDCTPDASFVGDEDRVRQILLNLLSNATKFTEPRGRITVSCGVTDSPDAETGFARGGEWVYFRVADTGIGIATEQLARVFDPFVQADGGHTRTRGGTGLGLTISRRLARLMEGDVTAHSRRGEGSTFTLWLPAARAAESGEATEREPRPPAATRVRGLTAVGECVLAESSRILDGFVRRLREEPRLPLTAAALPFSQLADHTATLLSDLAESLRVLEDFGGEPSQILADGTEIQRLIAERHGAQRARLGWSEEGIRREYAALRGAVEAVVRARLADPEHVPLDDALLVVTRFLEQAEYVSVRAWQRAGGA